MSDNCLNSHLFTDHQLNKTNKYFTGVAGGRDSQMALWSVSCLEPATEETRRGGPMAEDVQRLEPIIKFSNIAGNISSSGSHSERVRSLAYNRERYVSLLLILSGSMLYHLYISSTLSFSLCFSSADSGFSADKRMWRKSPLLGPIHLPPGTNT